MRQIYIDEYYMRQALELALRGSGKTTPNPLVGCVLVKDGEIVGRGWHDRLGDLHAEAAALRDAGENARGATAYVTLEPCSHQGRQPPCAPALVRAGIARCVCAIGDPNPKVNGRGFNILREASIEVVENVLASEAAWLDRGFFSLQTRARPWVTLKAAVSADGDMALSDGSSQWITGPEARAVGHQLRAENDVILTGIGTVEHDDPALTVREAEGPSPRPAILCADPKRLEKPYRVLRPETIVFTRVGQESPEKLNCQIVTVPTDELGRPSLAAVLNELGKMGLARLLVEAGPTITSEFIRLGLADEYQIFSAPKFMGAGQTLTKTVKLPGMTDVIPFKHLKTTPIGQDLRIEGVSAVAEEWIRRLYASRS